MVVNNLGADRSEKGVWSQANGFDPVDIYGKLEGETLPMRNAVGTIIELRRTASGELRGTWTTSGSRPAMRSITMTKIL